MMIVVVFRYNFFFKQKTAYEMRISDWSSDVCSSDLLAEERRKVTEYYMGKRPLQSREGGSKFVSQDVYLSVETMKSEIVETFGAGSQIVAFSPVTGDDVPLAKQAPSYSE